VGQGEAGSDQPLPGRDVFCQHGGSHQRGRRCPDRPAALPLAGGKPLLSVTSTKSHAGKDTVIAFASGATPRASVSYQSADWAFETAITRQLQRNQALGVVIVENVRLERRDETISSAFLERILTADELSFYAPAVGDGPRMRNHLVFAQSTNFGSILTDLMNRALPIHLAPVGDITDWNRQSTIGNPKHSYLPAHCDRIQAELRGMVERWKDKGRPLFKGVEHPFSDWARIGGGILEANGYPDFLGNYAERQTADDPLRRALGLLGEANRDVWLRPEEWVQRAVSLALARRIIPPADYGTEAGNKRGIGVVFSRHAGETF
jgi:hypothetical protein